MTRLGLPVPDGFTITTAACVTRCTPAATGPTACRSRSTPRSRRSRSAAAAGSATPRAPLLVSVRSGAAVSMPGMMDTILNLGLNDVAGGGAGRGDGRRALRLRLLPPPPADVRRRRRGRPRRTSSRTRSRGARPSAARKLDTDLTGDDLRGLCAEFKRLYREGCGDDFPQDPREQLRLAIDAVFRSWGAPRAHVYRRAHDISDDLGTAANICQMVFGNRGESSGTGVCFTPRPLDRRARALRRVPARTPRARTSSPASARPSRSRACSELLPEAYDELVATVERLEQHYRDMQDIEFTVEQGTLYMLQTRTGKRTAQAALRIVRDLVAEGVITPRRGRAAHRSGAARAPAAPAPRRLAPRSSRSRAASTPRRARPSAPPSSTPTPPRARGAAGEAVVLVRWETTPDDIHGLIQAQGVVTAHGGMTSHAAVVARGMGKPCVAGVESAKIDEAARTLTVGDVVVREGDMITIDGATGTLMLGALPLVAAELGEDFDAIATWADELRRLGVRANADTPEDARRARELGAEGIGLCRTEHMFMAAERLPVVREMILATRGRAARGGAREAAADAAVRLRGDLRGDGGPARDGPPARPAAARVPARSHRARGRARAAPSPGPERDRLERLAERVRGLPEQNPMLGTRGCRLALLHPEHLRDAGARDRARRARRGGARRGRRRSRS